MIRRVALSLLCAALVGSGVVTASCARAACPMGRAEMDCCKGPPAGISAPSCCDRAPELSRNTLPPATDRPVQTRMTAPLAAPLPPAATSVACAPQALRPVTSRAAPPGDTLVAQHTSLLL